YRTRACRTAPQKTSPIATSTATTAATKSRYIRLFAAPPPNSRPRPPKTGPMTDATTFPQAVAMSSHATQCCARGPSVSHGAAAATAISVRPFRMPSRCAIRQPRTSPGRWTPRAPGSGQRTILPRMTKVKGNPATRPTMKTSAPFATSKARSLSAIVHSSPKKRRRAASSAGCSGPENGTSGSRAGSAPVGANRPPPRPRAWGRTPRTRRPRRGVERPLDAGTDRLVDEPREIMLLPARWIGVLVVADVGAHAAAALGKEERDAADGRVEHDIRRVVGHRNAVEEHAGEEEPLGIAAHREARPFPHLRAATVGADHQARSHLLDVSAELERDTRLGSRRHARDARAALDHGPGAGCRVEQHLLHGR